MRLGQLRRLHHWLGLSNYLPGDEQLANRKKLLPVITDIINVHVEHPNETEITNRIEDKTIEQMEVDCFGHAITRLLLGGYAPGNYMGTCTTCEGRVMGDKRCRTCIDCAATRPINLS